MIMQTGLFETALLILPVLAREDRPELFTTNNRPRALPGRGAGWNLPVIPAVAHGVDESGLALFDLLDGTLERGL